MAGIDGFWEPVRSNVVDCFVQFFDYLLPRESLAVVRLVAHCLRERLAWCDADGAARAPREVVTLEELDEELDLDRKSVRTALARAVEGRYLEPVRLGSEEGGGTGFRIKLDLTRFTVEESQFDGFYPLPTHRIRVPLEFFTTVVGRETLATLKVVACIIRMTLGSVDNLGVEARPAIPQSEFVRRMDMGRRQAIEGVQTALIRGYIRRLEQGSLESGRPSTYGLFFRSQAQALGWPAERAELAVVSLGEALGKRDQEELGKRDQESGKKGSGEWEKGIRGVGKRDQGDGKKGSGDSQSDTDLIKDLDLRSERSSSANPPHHGKSASQEAAAAELYKLVRKRFPVGNPRLISEFIADRGAFVGEVLAAFDDIDPAFIRRFTRSADPRWAAFHTCCKQGMLPPVKKRAERAPSSEERSHESGEAPAGWGALAGEARIEALLTLWEKTARLYAGPPGEEARAEMARQLALSLARGETREALERFVVEDVARRRGRSIGPIFGS
jgi:hypothetical protein